MRLPLRPRSVFFSFSPFPSGGNERWLWCTDDPLNNLHTRSLSLSLLSVGYIEYRLIRINCNFYVHLAALFPSVPPPPPHHAKNMDIDKETNVVTILVSCVDAARPHC